jgi:hypothetical protein
LKVQFGSVYGAADLDLEKRGWKIRMEIIILSTVEEARDIETQVQGPSFVSGVLMEVNRREIYPK